MKIGNEMRAGQARGCSCGKCRGEIMRVEGERPVLYCSLEQGRAEVPGTACHEVAALQ